MSGYVPGLGAVPSAWDVLPARRVLQLQSHKPQPEDETVTAFRDGTVTLRRNRRLEGFTEADKYHGYQRVYPGELVIHSMDGFAGAIGVSDSLGQMSPVVHVYRVPKGEPRYLAYVLRAIAAGGYVTALAKGIRERSTSFDRQTIADLLLPLPPLEEQRRIANYLDDQTTRIDQTIQLRQQQTKLLLDGRRSALSELVGSLRGPLVPLGRLLRPRQEPGDVHSMVLSIYREHGVVPRDSRSDNFNRPPEDVARYQRVHRGDLVINKMKAWSGSVAVSPFDGVVSPDYLVCRPTAYVVNEFLHYVLRSPEWISHMRANSRGIRPQQERLYWQDLASITVPLPSARDQADFVHLAGQRIRSFDELSDPFRRSLSALEERRQAVVTAAVTGIA